MKSSEITLENSKSTPPNVDSNSMDTGPFPFSGQIRTGNPGLVNRVGSLATPLAAPLVLFVLNYLFTRTVSPPDIALGALSFFILFPGKWNGDRTRIDIGPTVLTPWAITSALLVAMGMATGYIHQYPTRLLIIWLIATPFVQSAVLYALPSMLRLVVRMRRPSHQVVVVGVNALGTAFARRVNNDPITHSNVVGFFDDRSSSRLGELLTPRPGNQDKFDLVGQLKDLPAYTRKRRIDQVYIALPLTSQRRILSLVESLGDCTASIFFLPDLTSIDLIQPRMDTHAGFPVVGLCETPFRGLNLLAKQAMDLLLAGMAVILLSPVMLAIALCIKLTSKGPVIFKQRRFGLDGSEILVWKFRSMTVTEDGAGQYTQVTKNDPRVTRVGALLRKTSLDELPQFINVLQGRMSIVGPRPHALKVNEQYRKLIPGYMVRHKVRPGITGWAQVNGYRGGDDLISMTKRIQYDLEYLRRWSVWLDLQILLRTASLVIKDSRAY